MADSSLTPWRGAWLRAVARRMKAWAEAVLAEEAASAPASTSVEAPRPEPSGSTPAGSRGAGSAEAAPVGSAASLESLEARWLRDLEARRSVPVADWVERVKKGAPHLLEELVREGLGPFSPSRPATAGVTRGPVPPARGAPSSTRAGTNEVRPAPSVGVQAHGQTEGSARPEAAFRVPAFSGLAPRGPPPARASHSPPPGTPCPEQELAGDEPSTSWGLGPGLFAAFRPPTAPPSRLFGARPHPPPERSAPTRHEEGTPARRSAWDDLPSSSREGTPGRGASRAAPPSSSEGGLSARRSPWDDLPSFASTSSTRAPTLVPRPMPPLSDAEPPAPSRPLASVTVLPTSGLPRARAPMPGQGALPGDSGSIPVDDGHWDGAQSPLPWRPRQVEEASPLQPVFPNLEEAPRSTEASEPSPWPELPPAPRAERTDTVVELRQWERLRRLDREQRGE